MSLTLHMHPLSSYCWKVLIALYENDTPFEARLLDLSDPAVVAAFKALWPTAKMPLLRDEARDRTVPETSTIIEYLQTTYPGPVRFIPDEPDSALRTRLMDRLFDLYVMTPMQTIVGDRIRPPDVAKDPYGVAQARKQLAMAYGLLETELAGRTWAAGEDFSLADCAAAPALFYADKVAPLGEHHPKVSAYLDRLLARPSFARVLREAEPYFAMFPTEDRA
jgi:glutathione S-transferase